MYKVVLKKDKIKRYEKCKEKKLAVIKKKK